MNEEFEKAQMNSLDGILLSNASEGFLPRRAAKPFTILFRLLQSPSFHSLAGKLLCVQQLLRFFLNCAVIEYFLK